MIKLTPDPHLPWHDDPPVRDQPHLTPFDVWLDHRNKDGTAGRAPDGTLDAFIKLDGDMGAACKILYSHVASYTAADVLHLMEMIERQRSRS